MQDVLTAEKIKTLTKAILDKGFIFEYFYEKGGDSSCVYICRYKKGKDFWDWREVSGSNQINIITYVNGEFGFPSLKAKYPKEFRKFALKHIFRAADIDKKREFVASLLNAELVKDETNFFGIKL